MNKNRDTSHFFNIARTVKASSKIWEVSLFLFLLIFIVQNIYAKETDKTFVKPTDYNFKTYFHSRLSYNTIANTTDLSNANDDSASYFAYLYDFGFDLKYVNSTEFFFKIARATRSNYDTPVSGSEIKRWPGLEFVKYTSTESALPRVTEFWLDFPVLESSMNTRFKLGLFSHMLGNGFTGGKYENYGFSFYNISRDFQYRLHAEISDYNNKIFLGPAIEQERVFAYENTNAFLVAGDFTVKLGNHYFEPYVSYLRDTTLNSSRASLIATPTDEDNLGIAGIMGMINFNPVTLDFEYAKNFGKAISSTKDYPDISHRGAFFYGNASLSISDVFIPKAGMILATGNKIRNADLENSKLTGDVNDAFSVFSPSNLYLFDTQYPKKSGPFIATGSGHAINYGMPRQGTFSNANLLENLNALDFGFGLVPDSSVYISLDYWILKSIEAYPGTNSLTDGSSRNLPTEVGTEMDIFCSLQLSSSVVLNLIYATFNPGAYYKERRNDYSGTGFTPLVRGDGKADNVSQLEIGIEFFF